MLNSFVTIQDWMIKKINLKGYELIIYAVIYGFSQDGESWFFGNLRYLEKWSGGSRSTVIRTLNSLIAKRLLKKKTILTEDKQKQCFYQVVCNLEGNKKNSSDDCKEVSIKKDGKEAVEPKKEGFQEPTVEEVKEYCNERSSPIDPQMFVDFYTSKGWYVGNRKMVDWRAAVRTWEQKEKQQQTRPIMRKITDAEQREINYQNTMRNIAKVAEELETMQGNRNDRL